MRRIFEFISLIALSCFLLIDNASARDIYVNIQSGDNITGNGTADSPWKHITIAIRQTEADLQPGDTIYCSPGVYNSVSDTYGFHEEFPISLPAGISLVGDSESDVIFDAGDQTDSYIYVADSFSELAISHLTFKNSQAAVHIENSTGVEMTDCVLDSNTTGVFVESGSSLIKSCTFTTNNTGVMCTGEVVVEKSVIIGHSLHGIHNEGDATIKNNNITDNSNVSGSGGAGIYNSGTISISNNSILRNTVTDIAVTTRTTHANGGGIFNTGIAYISENIINHNSVSSDGPNSNAFGGAIYNTGQMDVIDNEISNNSSSASSSLFAAAIGAGICSIAQSSTVTVYENKIDSNELFVATSGSGPNIVEIAYGAGVYCNGTSEIVGNTVSENSGNAIRSNGVSEIRNNYVFNNTSLNSFAGGIHCSGEFDVINNLLEGNVSTSSGAVYCTGEGIIAFCNMIQNTNGIKVGSSDVKIVNNIIAFNDEYGIYEELAGIEPSVINNLFWNNTAGLYLDESSTIITHIAVLNLQNDEASGNIEGDPLFANLDEDDFHLTMDSPCIGSAAVIGEIYEAPNEDIEGNLRPSANGYDIGAFQYSGEIPTQTPTIPPEPTVTPTPTIPESVLNTLQSCDLNKDGIVDKEDLIIFQAYWGYNVPQN